MVHRTKPARVSSSLIELRPALAAQTTNRRSHRCLTTGRLGNSHADGARARNPICTALFAFVTTDSIQVAVENRNQLLKSADDLHLRTRKSSPVHRHFLAFCSPIRLQIQEPKRRLGERVSLVCFAHVHDRWSSRQPTPALFPSRRALPGKNTQEKALFALKRGP